MVDDEVPTVETDLDKKLFLQIKPASRFNDNRQPAKITFSRTENPASGDRPALSTVTLSGALVKMISRNRYGAPQSIAGDSCVRIRDTAKCSDHFDGISERRFLHRRSDVSQEKPSSEQGGPQVKARRTDSGA